MEGIMLHGNIDHLTLNEVERAWKAALITTAQAKDYLVRWNATPGRFTVASLMAGRIRLADKD